MAACTPRLCAVSALALTPTTLAEVKQSKKFEDWALVRQGRLSTMAPPDKFVEWMRARYPGKKI